MDKEPKGTISIRLPLEDIRELERIAKQDDRTRSYIACKAIIEYLEAHREAETRAQNR